MTIVEALPNRIGRFLVWKDDGRKSLVLFSVDSYYKLLYDHKGQFSVENASVVGWWE